MAETIKPLGHRWLVVLSIPVFFVATTIVFAVDLTELTSTVPDGGPSFVAANVLAFLFALSWLGSAVVLWRAAWMDVTRTTRHATSFRRVVWCVVLVIGNFFSGWFYCVLHMTLDKVRASR